jgi:hypothetical protein
VGLAPIGSSDNSDAVETGLPNYCAATPLWE